MESHHLISFWGKINFQIVVWMFNFQYLHYDACHVLYNIFQYLYKVIILIIVFLMFCIIYFNVHTKLFSLLWCFFSSVYFTTYRIIYFKFYTIFIFLLLSLLCIIYFSIHIRLLLKCFKYFGYFNIHIEI